MACTKLAKEDKTMDLHDKIEKQVLLHAPTSRVWRTLADAREFGKWFGVTLTGEFSVGKTITGTFSETLDEDAMIRQQKELGVEPSGVNIPDNDTVFCTVERVEPERYFSFRWIPYAIDAEADPQNEHTTLVEFQLEAEGDDTRLTITESGFSQIPEHRRKRAFRMNDNGWTQQIKNIKGYVERS